MFVSDGSCDSCEWRVEVSESANYMRVVGPHCCIRCDFKCDTSDEMTEHLNSKHPGWMTEKLRPEMFTEPTKERALGLEPSEALWAIRKLVQCTKDDPCAYDNSCKNHRQLSDLLHKESAQREALVVEGCAVTAKKEIERNCPAVDIETGLPNFVANAIRSSRPNHAAILAGIERKARLDEHKRNCACELEMLDIDSYGCPRIAELEALQPKEEG